MTTQSLPTATVIPADAPSVLARAAGLGIALGVVDLLLIRLLPYPLADLANSSAMWAVAAFMLGRTLRATPVLAAAAGAAFLVVGVEVYYLAAAVLDLASPSAFLTPHAVAWCVMGVLAGAAFGAAGAWSLDTDVWRASAAVALVVGVLLAEAWLRRDLGDTAVLTAAAGLGALVVASRGPAVMALAAALALPLTVVCVSGFALAGF